MSFRGDIKLVEEVNRFFHDLTASLYKDMHPEIFRVQHRRMIKLLREHLKGHFPTILDVGSGDGFIFSVIRKSGALTFDRFIMLDISLQMLKVAREKHTDALFLNASSSDIPLKDESIDLITVNSVLHHLPDPERFLMEAKRILKKGGVLLINHEPNIRFSHNTILWYTSIVVSGIKRNFNPVRTLRRVIASIRGLGNPVYKEINRRLLKEGLIDKPLPDPVISAYIDYHSPTAGMLRRGAGIDPEIFGRYFKVRHIETYAHLGKVGEKHNEGLVKYIETLLMKRYPLDGSKLTAILVKE